MTQIPSQVEALQYVDTVVRSMHEGQLGKAELLSGEIIVDGHKAWRYEIEGLPMFRDGRRRWLLDTGETFHTTSNETEDTPEKALAKSRQTAQGVSSMDNERANLQSVLLLQPEEVFSRNVEAGQLSAYIKELVIAINLGLGDTAARCQLRVRVQLESELAPKFKIEHQGSIQNDTLQSIYDTITKVHAPAVKDDVLSLVALVDVV